MPQIIVIKPGELPKAKPLKDREVRLADLHREIGTLNVSASSLGAIPPQGTNVHMWYDDEGRLNDSAPNRRLPNGTVVCGTIVLCALVGPEDVGFNHEEVAFLMNNINAKWERLAPAERLPEPKPEFRTLRASRRAS